MKTKDTKTLVYLTFESNTLTVRNDTDIKPSCAFQLLLRVHLKDLKPTFSPVITGRTHACVLFRYNIPKYNSLWSAMLSLQSCSF